VAVKIVTKKKAPDDYLTKFLPREIQVMKHLRHENIVGLHEAIETSSRIYIILDLADNGDLLEFIRSNGAIQEDEARRLFHQLIDATEYLHNKGVVHRDLKCENILLNHGNRIIISDFGFARTQHIMPDTNKRRLSQTFCGSYAYAPPEILRGIAYDGTLADIWSLGVVLYTMVCASLPFDDTNLKVLLEQVSREVVFSRRRRVSDEVKDLVKKILVADVGNRLSIENIRRHPWFLGIKLNEVPKNEDGSKSVQGESNEASRSSSKKSGDSGYSGDVDT
jgi:serine kinase